jgi:hypothetical protein
MLRWIVLKLSLSKNLGIKYLEVRIAPAKINLPH